MIAAAVVRVPELGAGPIKLDDRPRVAALFNQPGSAPIRSGDPDPRIDSPPDGFQLDHPRSGGAGPPRLRDRGRHPATRLVWCVRTGSALKDLGGVRVPVGFDRDRLARGGALPAA